MAKKKCGGKRRRDPKTVKVKSHKRSKSGNKCYGPGKPGPKTVRVKSHKRSKP